MNVYKVKAWSRETGYCIYESDILTWAECERKYLEYEREEEVDEVSIIWIGVRD